MALIKSFHGKLILTGGVCVSVSIAVLSFLIYQTQEDRLARFHFDVFSHVSDVIHGTFAGEMSRGEMDSVRFIIMDQAADTCIAHIRLLDSVGQTVISTIESEDLPTFSRPALDSVLKTDSSHVYERNNFLSYIRRIDNSPECNSCHGSRAKTLGYLQIDFRFNPADLHPTGVLGMIIGSALFFITVLSATLWFFQNRFVRKPIEDLMSAIDTVGEGDLSVRVEVAGSDEIGRLAASFNHLIMRLEKAHNELEALHSKQMEQAERLASAGELASGVAHEIKNPLAGIAATISVLLDKAPEGSVDKNILTEMEVQIKRIAETVKDLLTYACPPVPEFREGNINENIKRCVTFVSAAAEKQETKLVTDLAPELPFLLMDSALMDQVIVNILLNALQALKSGGTISLSSEFNQETREIQVVISDDGPGIPEHIRERLFRPFFTTKHKGSGLGLSICSKNVERHQGTIVVSSNSGQGAVFAVRLPVDTTFEQLIKQELV